MTTRRWIICAALALAPDAAHAQPPRPFNPCDFDGDSKADLTIVRETPAGLEWWIRLSSGGIQQFTWGMPGDLPTQMSCPDVDGDARADATVWRSSVFWSRLSSGGIRTQYWGRGGDDPRVTADYDGDSRADYAVYRFSLLPGEFFTYWILESSTGAVRAEAWGAGDFVQTVPDYDGDGKADFGVRRGSLVWRKLSSSGSVDVVEWGSSDEGNGTADHDGDGRSDIVSVRRVDAFYQWWIRSSSTGGALSPYGNGSFFGGMPDFRVIADYDGDGRADVAVYRHGTWWILSAATGLTTIVWGGSGDLPLQWVYSW